MYHLYVLIRSLKLKEIINEGFFLTKSSLNEKAAFNDLIIGNCLLGSNPYTCEPCFLYVIMILHYAHLHG